MNLKFSITSVWNRLRPEPFHIVSVLGRRDAREAWRRAPTGTATPLNFQEIVSYYYDIKHGYMRSTLQVGITSAIFLQYQAGTKG